MENFAQAAPTGARMKTIKCVVWDLDHTLWSGILLEDGDSVRLRPSVVETIAELDRRGILHSIASRNDFDTTMAKLTELGVAQYFLYPQIGWDAKSASVAKIAKLLNIGIDSLAFVDDQPFEREEVAFAHPDVLCIDALDAGEIATRAEFQPKYVTEDSAARRAMYIASIDRTKAEDEFTGNNEEFLSTLGMEFKISRARRKDLGRAEELVVRTNQLNSTGVMYSEDELAQRCDSDRHLLLMAELTDVYGSYGQIGLASVALEEREWKLELLLMSCRVMSRGVGTVLLNHVVGLAQGNGARLVAAFVPTGRNRIMYVTYRFAGFEDLGEKDGVSLLVAPLTAPPKPPAYLNVITD
ncbi:HAD-IIIC family phosphatase [Nocardia sp. NPDC057663]|uniref:HAD-IIIC family phosphatase n=1 Tax=Nocardia sp. NPDC057663 TaxID=3346201 RepID=UPI00366FE03F